MLWTRTWLHYLLTVSKDLHHKVPHDVRDEVCVLVQAILGANVRAQGEKASEFLNLVLLGRVDKLRAQLRRQFFKKLYIECGCRRVVELLRGVIEHFIKCMPAVKHTETFCSSFDLTEYLLELLTIARNVLLERLDGSKRIDVEEQHRELVHAREDHCVEED